MSGLAKLRPYQSRIARAVLHSAYRGDGRSFTVLISRQGGKNELSAQLELLRLVADAHRGGEAVKCAPTFDPQCLISLRRLWSCLDAVGLGAEAGARTGLARSDGGNGVRLGRAVQRFLSADPAANVVGHTVSRLLECDEAQDVAREKFDKDFRPMAATSNATIVYYGTAWDETCLLAEMAAHHRELERRDGVKRHFAVPWDVVAEHNPAYAAFVSAERERLGEAHPLFQTQYLLRTLPGSGRLLAPAAVDLCRGDFPRLAAPDASRGGRTAYVGGLDVGGETFGGTGSAAGREPAGSSGNASRGGSDASVLAVARASFPPAGAVQEPSLDVVALYAWRGVTQTELVRQVAGLTQRFGLRALAVDCTGVGEGVGSALAATPGLGVRLERLRFSEPVKSALGYSLQAAAGSGRLRLYRDAEDPELREAFRQLQLARATYRPNRMLAWEVDPRDGHDDHLVALALCVHAAAQARPATAVGHLPEAEPL